MLVPHCEPTTPLLLHGVVSGAAGAYCGALSAAPLLLHGVVRGEAYCDAVFLPGEPSSRGINDLSHHPTNTTRPPPTSIRLPLRAPLVRRH